MAIDYIAITKTNRPQLGTQLIRAANLTREIRDLVDSLGDAASRMNDGSNYTTFETNFGVAPGQGANVTSLIALIQDILNTNVTVAGADRLARLDEFVSRIAGQ